MQEVGNDNQTTVHDVRSCGGSRLRLADHLVLDVSPARAQQIDPLQGHFHPKGKTPSKFTLEVLKKAKATLPFADERDFEEQMKDLLLP
jgi:hypothetical protein